MFISKVTKKKNKNIGLTRLNKPQIPSHEQGGKPDGNKIQGNKTALDSQSVKKSKPQLIMTTSESNLVKIDVHPAPC